MAWVKLDGGGPEFTNRVGYKFLSYQTLAKLAQNPGQLPFIRAAAGHPDVVQAVMSEEQAQAALEQIRAANAGRLPAHGAQRVGTVFVRGKIFRHKPSGRKVTIIHAAAGRKDGETVHEVVDASTGKKFMARESNLKGLA